MQTATTDFPATFVMITFTLLDTAERVREGLDGARVLYSLDAAAVGSIQRTPGGGGCYLILPPSVGASRPLYNFHRWVVETLSHRAGLAAHIFTA
jgi:hypothetical protein